MGHPLYVRGRRGIKGQIFAQPGMIVIELIAHCVTGGRDSKT